MPFDIITRAMSFAPSSIDETARTVELIASTGAGVRRWDMDGEFTEVLSLDSDAVDFSRVDGMPLLDSHRQDSLEAVLGVVRSARIEASQLAITAQVSERHEAIWTDVKAGVIRNVSVGYEPLEWKDSVDPVTGARVRTITKWKLMECSLVPVGADAGAKTRNSEMPTPNTQTPPAPAVTPTPIQMRAALNQEIRALGQTFQIDATAIDAMIDRQATVDEARAEIMEAMRIRQDRPAPMPRVVGGIDNTSPDVFVERAAEALHCRANPVNKPSEPAKPFMGMTMVDMARESLRLRSVSTTGLSPTDLVKRALHTTSDFPLLLGNTANREVRRIYQAAPAVLKALGRQTTAADFKAKSKIMLGEAPTLEKVNEKGEFKRGSIAEAAESYKVDTFGKIIGLSRQAIVNDDLGAFNDLARIFGLGAVEFENQFLVDLLLQNSGNGPTMSDGKTLFHTDHGNKAASGAAIAEATLSAARTAMRKQKGLSGKPINVPPKFLLVPSDLETTGEKQLAVIQPTASGDVNPFGGKLSLAVEARLTSATRWYIVADPAVIDGLEYAYLAGEEGPQVESRAGFEVDGLEIKCRLDFGAGFNDWRGWFTNPGA